MRMHTNKNTLTGEITNTPMPYTTEEAIEELKLRRNLELVKGHLLPSGLRLQTDIESTTNILGLIKLGELAAAANQPFTPAAWSLGGGNYIPVDKSPISLPELIELGLLMGTHQQACHAKYQAAYAYIHNNVDGVDGVDFELVINEGWPV